MKRELNQNLDIKKIVNDFQCEEKSPSHRKGTFKIDKPFDEALNVVLKVKPGRNKNRNGEK